MMHKHKAWAKTRKRLSYRKQLLARRADQYNECCWRRWGTIHHIHSWLSSLRRPPHLLRSGMPACLLEHLISLSICIHQTTNTNSARSIHRKFIKAICLPLFQRMKASAQRRVTEWGNLNNRIARPPDRPPAHLYDWKPACLPDSCMPACHQLDNIIAPSVVLLLGEWTRIDCRKRMESAFCNLSLSLLLQLSGRWRARALIILKKRQHNFHCHKFLLTH